MEVTVDGITYLPAGQARTSIGIGITVHNRPELLTKALEQHNQFRPPDSVLVIVDDASTIPVENATHRFDQRVGIARAKNKCLELLADASVDHIFLFDDDTYPIADNWWQPYIDSPEPHLMHIFAYKSGPPIVAHDEQHTAWAHPTGCMLYVHRRVLDVVGGMDTAYGTWGHEHVDYSNRIHNAGLTTWRFTDVTGSDQLIFCLDSKGTTRSVSDAERRQQHAKNTAYYETQIDSAAYKPYRTPRNVVLTAWQHGPDRQRNGQVSKVTTAEATKALRASIRGGDLIVLGDDATADQQITNLGLDIYLSRWVHFRRWLGNHPEAVWVWLVDANDVTMLTPPWDEMRPDTLYMGHESTILDGKWMRTTHPSKRLQEFFDKHATLQLLNCGIIGGDRATIIRFLTHLIRLIEDNAHDRWRNADKHPLGNDMGPTNYVARTRFADRLEWGSRVATVFKAEETNAWSWWKHK